MAIAEPKDFDEPRAVILIAQHSKADGGLLPALHAIQREFGYIPAPAIKLLASAFNLTRAEVFGVASFYHDFRLNVPRGRNVLRLCRAEACQAVGGRELAGRAQQRLGINWGETTKDGQWSLEQVFCLGLCAIGPAAMVNGELVGRLDTARLDGILPDGERT